MWNMACYNRVTLVTLEKTKFTYFASVNIKTQKQINSHENDAKQPSASIIASRADDEPNDDPSQTAGYCRDRRVAGLCDGHRGEGRERQATERVTGHGNSQRRQRLQRASQPYAEER